MHGQTRIAAAAALGLGLMCCFGSCPNPVSKDEKEKTLSGTLSGWSFGSGCSVLIEMGTDGAILREGPYPISSSGEFSVPYPGNLAAENTRDMGWADSKGLTVSDADARLGMLFLSVRNGSNESIGELVMSKGEGDYCRLYYFSKPVAISGTFESEDEIETYDIDVPAAGWNRLFIQQGTMGESTTMTMRTGLSAKNYSWILYESNY